MMEKERVVWLDYLRVMACFMVMVVHSTEPFYLGGEGTLIASYENGLWSAFFDSVVRCCVPLFVIASSYLLLPLNYSTVEFFRRRAKRIIIPFVIWSVFYAFWFGEPVSNLHDLMFNFNYAAGHLWFVYMLLGLYLLMPILSPWAERVGKRELSAYIALWLFTTIIPLIRDWLSSDPLAVTYGPTGIPHQALYPLWGEASWNHYGMFYYFSGFMGYLMLGLWLRKFGSSITTKKSIGIGIPTFLLGFAIVMGGFVLRMSETAQGVYPVSGGVSIAVWLETTWCNDTLGVALETIGLILIMRTIKCSGAFYRRLILPVSRASYGMYLVHMVALVIFAGIYSEQLTSTPIIILATAVSTFVTVALFAVLVQKIPYVGKYLVG